MNRFRELNKYIEFYSGRAIEVLPGVEGEESYGPFYWVAQYSRIDGQTISTKCIYPTATQAIEAVREMVILEIHQEHLTNRLQELMMQLESEGYLPEEILKSLADFACQSNDWYKVTQFLEAAAEVAKDSILDPERRKIKLTARLSNSSYYNPAITDYEAQESED